MEEERCTCDKKQQSPLCNTCIKYAIADDYANVGERCARCGEVTVCARCDKPAALIFAPAVNYDEREREDEDDDSEEGITTPKQKKETTMANALKNTLQRSKRSAATTGGMLAARVPNKQLVKLALKYIPKKDLPWAHTAAGKAALEILVPHVVMLTAEYGHGSLPNAQAVGNAAEKALQAAMFENGTVLQDMLLTYLAPFWGEAAKVLKPLTKE